jgi:hypothetical protein
LEKNQGLKTLNVHTATVTSGATTIPTPLRQKSATARLIVGERTIWPLLIPATLRAVNVDSYRFGVPKSPKSLCPNLPYGPEKH